MKVRIILVLFLAGLVLVFTMAQLQFFENLAPSDRPVVINNTPVPPVPTLDASRLAAGAELYSIYCAGCHGANLEGAPDWKKPLPDGSYPPPPHDSSGHTWHHPDELLLSITLDGGDPAYDSRMPGFGDRFAEDEALSILEFIKSRWGKEEREYQWWITASQRP